MIIGFSIDVYNCSVTFAWDTHEKELETFFKKVKVKDEYRKSILSDFNQEGCWACTTDIGGDIFTFFKDQPCHKTIAHEIYHAAKRILDTRGVNDEEATAYLIDFITEMFYEQYEKTGKDKED